MLSVEKSASARKMSATSHWNSVKIARDRETLFGERNRLLERDGRGLVDGRPLKTAGRPGFGGAQSGSECGPDSVSQLPFIGLRVAIRGEELTSRHL